MMLHLLEEFSYPLGRNKEMLKSVRKSFCTCFLVLPERIFFLFLQVKAACEGWDQIIFRTKGGWGVEEFIFVCVLSFFFFMLSIKLW